MEIYAQHLGLEVMQGHKFDTLTIYNIDCERLKAICEKNQINLRYRENSVSISFDEVTKIYAFFIICRSLNEYTGIEKDYEVFLENF